MMSVRALSIARICHPTAEADPRREALGSSHPKDFQNLNFYFNFLKFYIYILHIILLNFLKIFFNFQNFTFILYIASKKKFKSNNKINQRKIIKHKTSKTKHKSYLLISDNQFMLKA